MAVKSEPIDMDSEPPVLFTKSVNGSPGSRSSAHDDSNNSSQPLNLTSHPVNFLTEQGRPEMVVDPVHNDVMFLHPQPRPRSDGGAGEDGSGEGSGGGGRGGQRVPTRREVTEYATYTISHHEEELNSKLLPKKYRCRFCVYKTSYKSDLNRHLRKHGIAPQHCPLCNMPFKTTGNLENHMRQTHGDMTAGILPPSPSSSSSALPGLCLDAGGFLSPAAALAMAAPAALPPVVGGVVVPCVGLPPSSSSSSDLVQFEPSRGRGTHHSHHLSRRLESQLQQEFPALSQAVLSPAQLSCHVCSFVCSDSEVLARHLLTHPAEEEVSRVLASRTKPDEGSALSPAPLSEAVLRRSPLTPDHRSSVSVTKLACNYCGAVLSSIDELQLHRLSCVDPAEDVQCTNGEDLRCQNTKDSQRQDSNKDDSGEASGSTGGHYREAIGKNVESNPGLAERTLQGLPRQETMEKLRRTLTSQTLTMTPSNTRTAPSQNQAPNQQQSSMILPHIPATENANSGNAVIRKTYRADTSLDSQESSLVRMVIDSDDSSQSVLICEDDASHHQDADKHHHSYSHATGGGKSNPDTPGVRPTREFVTWSDEDSDCELTVETDGQRRASTPAYNDTAATRTSASRDAQPAHADIPRKPKRPRLSSPRDGNSSPTDLGSFQHWRNASDHVLEVLRRDAISVKEEPGSPGASSNTEAAQSRGGCAPMIDGHKDPKSQAERAGDRRGSGVDKQTCALCGKMIVGKNQLFRHLRQAHDLNSRLIDSSSIRKLKQVSNGDPGNVGDGRSTRVSNLGHNSSRRTTGWVGTARREGGSKFSRIRPPGSAGVSTLAQATNTAGSRSVVTETHSFSRSHPAAREKKTSARPVRTANQKVSSHPPSSGRYAKLVSDFDEFSRKPYACSLCFFRTARLGELRTHVHNHLTGGNTAPVPATARLECVEAFSVERGTSPGARINSLDVRNTSPDVRSTSSSVRSNSPGSSVDSPGVRITSSDIKVNSPVVRCSSPGVRNNSPFVKSNSLGVRCNSSVVQSSSPGVESNSPDVRITFPGIRSASPNVRNTSPGVRNTSPGVKINCGSAPSDGFPSPPPCGNKFTAVALLSAEDSAVSPRVRPKSVFPSSLGSQSLECVDDVSDAPARTELLSTERDVFPVEMNSVSRTGSASQGSLVVSGIPERADGGISSMEEGFCESNAPSVSDSGVSVSKTHDLSVPATHTGCGSELNVVASEGRRSSSSCDDCDRPKVATENSPEIESATTARSSLLSPAVVAEATASSHNEPHPLDLTCTASMEKSGTLGNGSVIVTDDGVTATLFNDDDNNNNIRRGDTVQTETPDSICADDGNKTSSHSSCDAVGESAMEAQLSPEKFSPDRESSSRGETRASQKPPLEDFTESRSVPIVEEFSTENVCDPVHLATSSSKKAYHSPLFLSPRKPVCRSHTAGSSRYASVKRSRWLIHIVNRKKGKSAVLRWKNKLSRRPTDLLSRDWSNDLGCTNTRNRCSHCGKSFSLKQLLVRHMRCIH